MHELQVESNGSPQATTRSSRALNYEIRPFTDAKSHIFFAVMQQVGEYARAKSAREGLFTVASLEEKYKPRTVSIQRSRVGAMRRLNGL
jgi:hypothetical protein